MDLFLHRRIPSGASGTRVQGLMQRIRSGQSASELLHFVLLRSHDVVKGKRDRLCRFVVLSIAYFYYTWLLRDVILLFLLPLPEFMSECCCSIIILLAVCRCRLSFPQERCTYLLYMERPDCLPSWRLRHTGQYWQASHGHSSSSPGSAYP
jgi:hypothetical protein